MRRDTLFPLLLLAPACTASHVVSPGSPEPSATRQPRAAVEVVSPGDVEGEPAEPPASAAVEFAVVAEGRCKNLDVSFVGDHRYLHAHDWIARIDERGQVAERLDRGRSIRGNDHADITDNEVMGVVGFDPQPMIALVHRGTRGDSYIGTDVEKRTADGKWVDMDVFGKDAYARGAWPWWDGSILLLGERRWDPAGGRLESWNGEHAVRFGVARGRPKGPHLSAFKTSGSNCPLDVWAAHATPRGDVVAVVGCRTRTTKGNHGTWAMRWFQEDLEGRTQKLTERDYQHGMVVIGPEGESVVALLDERGYEVFALDGDTWKAKGDTPGGKLVALALDRDQRVWLATDRALVREGGAQGWDDVGPAGASGLRALAGVEHGTPWLLAKDAAWSADEHGRWTAAKLPAPAWFPNEGTLSLTRIEVPRPGEVWVTGGYESTWPRQMGPGKIVMMGVDYAALLTNATIASPLRCGIAVDPAYPPIDLRPWPLGHRDGCQQKLVMLMRLRKFDGLTGYAGLRKVLRVHEALRDVAFVELEGSGQRLLGAMVTTDEQAELLGDGVRGYRSALIKPEASCGDADALAAAGFRVARTLTIDPSGRAFEVAPVVAL
jgi:hypothetical protein